MPPPPHPPLPKEERNASALIIRPDGGMRGGGRGLAHSFGGKAAFLSFSVCFRPAFVSGPVRPGWLRPGPARPRFGGHRGLFGGPEGALKEPNPSLNLPPHSPFDRTVFRPFAVLNPNLIRCFSTISIFFKRFR